MGRYGPLQSVTFASFISSDHRPKPISYGYNRWPIFRSLMGRNIIWFGFSFMFSLISLSKCSLPSRVIHRSARLHWYQVVKICQGDPSDWPRNMDSDRRGNSWSAKRWCTSMECQRTNEESEEYDAQSCQFAWSFGRRYRTNDTGEHS